MEENQTQIIKTIGEQGEEILMELQEVVTIEDRDYALLTLADEENKNKSDEEKEVIIMRMHTEGDDCTFEVIEDDEEFNFVAQAISDEADDEE